jgi:hypothetical protein
MVVAPRSPFWPIACRSGRTASNCDDGGGCAMHGSTEDRLRDLESKATEAHARLAELAALPEIVLIVQECIIDLADAVEELRGEAPDGLNRRLERLEQLCNVILEIDRTATQGTQATQG